jgi:hypothetical protein
LFGGKEEKFRLVGATGYVDCGLSLLFFDPRPNSFRPAGNVETGRNWDDPALERPLISSDGRGPSFTLGLVLDPYEEKLYISGLEYCEDFLSSSVLLVVLGASEDMIVCGDFWRVSEGLLSKSVDLIASGGCSGVGEGWAATSEEMEGNGAADGFSSCTIDCLFTLCSSSSSSAISISRRRRSELVEDDNDPEAVCNEHAADSVESFNSFATFNSKTVSWGNFSVMAVKCTLRRAWDYQL